MVYYTAITLKLNTKPWQSVTSSENYLKQLNYICHTHDCQLMDIVAWEIDNCCQLHCHATLKSKKALFRKNICSDYRKHFKKHNIWLVPISQPKNWHDYCSKSENEEPKYHWLCRYYDSNYPEQFNNESNVRANDSFNLDNLFINKQNHWEKLQPDFID